MADKSAAELLVEQARIKAQIEALQHQAEAVGESLIEALVAEGKKSISVTLDSGDAVKGTLVEPQRVTYDEGRLETAVGPKVWSKVTKRVLDKAKLEAAITMGDVDANVVAACAQVADSKPYVRISGAKGANMAYTAPVTKVTPAMKKRVKIKKGAAA